MLDFLLQLIAIIVAVFLAKQLFVNLPERAFNKYELNRRKSVFGLHNKRSLSKKSIIAYIDLLTSRVVYNSRYFNNYKISKKSEKKLLNGDFSINSLNLLVNDIKQYLNLDYLIYIKYDLNCPANKIAYIVKRELYYEILLHPNIEKEIDSIVSVIAHEISHIVIDVCKLNIENNLENEWLTDFAAVYLGFSEYLLSGYKYKELKHKQKGYIKPGDIKYAKKYLAQIMVNK